MGRQRNGKTHQGKRNWVAPKFNPDDSPATGRENCPHPFKVAYGSRAAAKRGRTKFSAGKDKRLSAYLCRCGNWHLGKLPGHIKRGKLSRPELG